MLFFFAHLSRVYRLLACEPDFIFSHLDVSLWIKGLATANLLSYLFTKPSLASISLKRLLPRERPLFPASPVSIAPALKSHPPYSLTAEGNQTPPSHLSPLLSILTSILTIHQTKISVSGRFINFPRAPTSRRLRPAKPKPPEPYVHLLSPDSSQGPLILNLPPYLKLLGLVNHHPLLPRGPGLVDRWPRTMNAPVTGCHAA